jgi:hypothetical protein
MPHLPQTPKVNAKHPRIVVNAAALTKLVYTGINVVQDMAAGHFTSDDKVLQPVWVYLANTKPVY